MNDTVVPIELDDLASVLDLKRAIEKRSGIPSSAQRLSFSLTGEPLLPEEFRIQGKEGERVTLSYLGVCSGTCITVEGLGPHHILVEEDVAVVNPHRGERDRYLAVLGVEDVLMLVADRPEELGVYRAPDLTFSASPGLRGFLRPGCTEFFEWALEHMDIALWSDGPGHIAATVAEKLCASHPGPGRVVATFGNEDFIKGAKTLSFVEDVTGRDHDRMFLVDVEESCLAASTHPNHAVPVPAYFGLPLDNSLLELSGFLSAGVLRTPSMAYAKMSGWPFALQGTTSRNVTDDNTQEPLAPPTELVADEGEEESMPGALRVPDLTGGPVAQLHDSKGDHLDDWSDLDLC